MKRRRAAFLPALLLLLLTVSGCAVQQPPENTVERQVYFAPADSSAAGAALRGEAHHIPEEDDGAEILLRLLLAGPRSEHLSPLIPEGTRVLSWSLEDGVLQLDLSGEYGALSGIDLTLADYSIAETLCQLEQVSVVTVTVEGESIRSRTVQTLSPVNVMSSLDRTGQTERIVTLYFPTADGTLGAELRTIRPEKGQSLADAALNALCTGPENRNLKPVFPDSSVLLGAELKEHIYYVDFAESFRATEQNRRALDALVKTVSGLSGVNGVQPMWENRILEIWGAKDTSMPLTDR